MKKSTKIFLTVLTIVSSTIGFLSFYNLTKDTNGKSVARFNKLIKINAVHIKEVGEKNDVAASNAVENIKAVFNRLRTNVGPAVDELYSLKNKMKFIGKSAADLCPGVENKHRVENLVTNIFAKYFGSESEMANVLNDINEGYKREITANKNQFILSIEYDTEVENQKSIRISKKDFLDLFNEEMAATIKPLVGFSIGGEISSIVVGEAVTYIIIQTTTMITGSSLAGAWTFGIGLVAGIAVDLAATKVCKHEMKKKLIATIDEIEKVMLYGTKEKAGVVEILKNHAREVTNAEREALVQSLKLSSRK